MVKLSTNRKSLCFRLEILRQHLKPNIGQLKMGNECTYMALSAMQDFLKRYFNQSYPTAYTFPSLKSSPLPHFTALVILLPAASPCYLSLADLLHQQAARQLLLLPDTSSCLCTRTRSLGTKQIHVPHYPSYLTPRYHLEATTGTCKGLDTLQVRKPGC